MICDNPQFNFPALQVAFFLVPFSNFYINEFYFCKFQWPDLPKIIKLSLMALCLTYLISTQRIGF